jgi:glycogen operon protein
MLQFTRSMIAFRHRHPSLSRERFLTGEPQEGQDLPDIRWYGPSLDDPAWDDIEARTLAFTLAGDDPEEPPLHVMLNMEEEATRFGLPSLPGRRWHLAVDTANQAAIADPETQPAVDDEERLIAGRSVVVLEGRRT